MLFFCSNKEVLWFLPLYTYSQAPIVECGVLSVKSVNPMNGNLKWKVGAVGFAPGGPWICWTFHSLHHDWTFFRCKIEAERGAVAKARPYKSRL